VILTATAGSESDVETKTDYVTVSAAVGSELVTRTITYTYDSLYRLIGADYSSGEEFAYAYDAVGNMTALTATITNTVVTTKVYDAANRLITVTTGGVARTLEWSDAGELLRDGDDAYAWDAAGRLVRARVDGVLNRYAYLGDGGRISMTVGGETTTYTLDLASLLVQVLVAHKSAGQRVSTYLYGVSRVGEEQPEGWLYHANDYHSVRQLVDNAGNVKLAQGYQPYGQVLWREGTASSMFGFTGEQVDSTGLIYLRARMYAPLQGRFLTRDPWEGNDERPLTLGDYLYALANPINVLDPSGLCGFSGDTPEQQAQCEALRGFIADVYHVNVKPGKDTRGGRDLTLYWSLEEMMTLLAGLEEWLIALGGWSAFLADMGGEFDVKRIKGRSTGWESVELGDTAFFPFLWWPMGKDGRRRPRTVIHEIAHLWSNRTGYQKEFEDLFWRDDKNRCEGEDPVTGYGKENDSREDFAEAATEMILRGGLVERRPLRLNFMLERMKGLWNYYGPPSDVEYPCETCK
jgi:RHS repeat-associated protein